MIPDTLRDMSGLLEGHVALITGAARGQGRSHAVRLAQEGADIIATDISTQIETVKYDVASSDDLSETVRLVEAEGRRIVARQADVRDFEAVQAAVDDGIAELGHVDIVCANAGIGVQEVDSPTWKISAERWRDVIDVNLTGVWHTIKATVPAMIERDQGGSVVIINSTAGLKGQPFFADYAASKHGCVGLMRTLAKELAPHGIRVNSIHPTGVRTPMVENEALAAFVEANPEMVATLSNMLPVDMLEPSDVTNALLWLVSDAARYVTAVALPVDAGFTQK